MRCWHRDVGHRHGDNTGTGDMAQGHWRHAGIEDTGHYHRVEHGDTGHGTATRHMADRNTQCWHRTGTGGHRVLAQLKDGTSGCWHGSGTQHRDGDPRHWHGTGAPHHVPRHPPLLSQTARFRATNTGGSPQHCQAGRGQNMPKVGTTQPWGATEMMGAAPPPSLLPSPWAHSVTHPRTGRSCGARRSTRTLAPWQWWRGPAAT